MRICIYCASSAKIDEIYFEATERLAKILVNSGVQVIYGGGGHGLMGKLADTVLAQGGQIKGIMPQFMNEVEWAHKSVTDFEFTKTMHERKAKFLENIDALIALPGGTGTLEELLEAITLKRLGQFTKPIIILNTNGYYDPLILMLKRCVEEKFLRPIHAEMWTFVHQPEEVMSAINQSMEWDENAISFAAV
ncbi:cytokinin riboside 5'-monophosphate phosphoribohydrolase [Bacteroidota bacterium]|nr:cytokinin riboside 5'-monophosphate phosphoribohydrolase [Bacteroidota bacterium]